MNPEQRVLDAIDELVNESLQHGPTDDYTQNRYPHCPQCGHDWHGTECEGTGIFCGCERSEGEVPTTPSSFRTRVQDQLFGNLAPQIAAFTDQFDPGSAAAWPMTRIAVYTDQIESVRISDSRTRRDISDSRTRRDIEFEFVDIPMTLDEVNAIADRWNNQVAARRRSLPARDRGD